MFSATVKVVPDKLNPVTAVGILNVGVPVASDAALILQALRFPSAEFHTLCSDAQDSFLSE